MTTTATFTETFVNAADVKVQLRRGGKGEPLLVIPGELGVPGWINAYKELAKDFDVIVPSLPGFGQSSRPEWLMTVKDLAAWITWFIRDQKLPTPLNVVGLSMGAWAVGEIATTNSQIFKKMVLVGPGGLKPEHGEIFDYFVNSAKDAFEKSFHNPKACAEYTQYYGKDWTPEEADQVEVNREMACRITWKPYMHNITLHWLAQGIKTPTLIVHGRQDQIVPLNAGERWKKIVPGAQIKVIDNCGHMVEMEKPAELVAAVKTFLKG